jgi:hypothetical protein
VAVGDRDRDSESQTAFAATERTAARRPPPPPPYPLSPGSLRTVTVTVTVAGGRGPGRGPGGHRARLSCGRRGRRGGKGSVTSREPELRVGAGRGGGLHWQVGRSDVRPQSGSPTVAVTVTRDRARPR